MPVNEHTGLPLLALVVPILPYSKRERLDLWRKQPVTIFPALSTAIRAGHRGKGTGSILETGAY
jgi:hypothetical protein